MPTYLQREKWAEILGVSLHHKRLSSTRYYLIQMIGNSYIHQVNQVSLYMLFMLRRLHKRTVGRKREYGVVELMDKYKLRNIVIWLHNGTKERQKDDQLKLKIAETHETNFMKEKVSHAFLKLRRLSNLLSQESLFYSTLRQKYALNPIFCVQLGSFTTGMWCGLWTPSKASTIRRRLRHRRLSWSILIA